MSLRQETSSSSRLAISLSLWAFAAPYLRCASFPPLTFPSLSPRLFLPPPLSCFLSDLFQLIFVFHCLTFLPGHCTLDFTNTFTRYTIKVINRKGVLTLTQKSQFSKALQVITLALLSKRYWWNSTNFAWLEKLLFLDATSTCIFFQNVKCIV